MNSISKEGDNSQDTAFLRSDKGSQMSALEESPELEPTPFHSQNC